MARSASAALGALGIALFLLAWQLVGQYRLAGMSWPALTTVLHVLTDPHRAGMFHRAVAATLRSVCAGYAIGGGFGFGAALLAHLAPALRPGTDRLTAVIHAIPAVAMAPVFVLLLGQGAVPVAVCALNVFFALFVATSSGVASVPAAQDDVFRVLGSRRIDRFWRLELPAALPAILGGMRLAVPSALIGAILGEWFGAPRGLGLLMVAAMQNFEIPLLWSAVLLTIATSLALFGGMTLLERVVVARFR